MSAAIRKEIRLLMPAWIVALVAATVPVWVMGWGVEWAGSRMVFPPVLIQWETLEKVHEQIQSMHVVSLCFFAIGALLLSLASFGSEMSFGTFSSLLALPHPRVNTWRMKTGLLASALTLVVAAAALSWSLRKQAMLAEVMRVSSVPLQQRFEPWPDHLHCILLLAVLAFVGGLWTTLLLRQIVTAFWVAILIPWFLFFAFSLFLHMHSDNGSAFFEIAFLAPIAFVYAAVGYCLARWLFLHAQEKQVLESTDSMTWSFLPAFSKARKPAPVVALLVKELRLHEGTLLIAAGVVILYLAAMVGLDYLPAISSKYTSLEEVWLLFWMLWWLAPLLIGCASVAEERRGQTLQSALCLPVDRIIQFSIKLLVVFGLGLFLGAVMPWMLEHVRPETALKHNSVSDFGLHGLLLPAAIITGIGSYASSLSETFLQAISGALGLVLIWVIVFGSCPLLRGAFGSANQHISWPFLIVTCIFLSYSNFKQLRITRLQWLRNGLILLAVIYTLSVITGAIDARFRPM